MAGRNYIRIGIAAVVVLAGSLAFYKHGDWYLLLTKEEMQTVAANFNALLSENMMLKKFLIEKRGCT